jgi:hypothetical protein
MLTMQPTFSPSLHIYHYFLSSRYTPGHHATPGCYTSSATRGSCYTRVRYAHLRACVTWGSPATPLPPPPFFFFPFTNPCLMRYTHKIYDAYCTLPSRHFSFVSTQYIYTHTPCTMAYLTDAIHP